MVFRGWSGPPSLSRQFLHHKHTPFGNKKVLVPLREQGQKDKFLRYHLVCRPKNGRSARCQHTGCPLTLALRQKILRFPVSLCPLRPICCPAFRSALSFAELSVDALTALLPLLRFSSMKLCSLYNKNVRLSRTILRQRRTGFNTPGQRPGPGQESGHWCRRWGRNCHFPA